MGFLARLIAGLVSAATLGMGVAGTADTADVSADDATVTATQTADTTGGLPTELVNGDFQTYGNQIINLRASSTRYLTFVDGNGNVMKDGASQPWTKFNGWNATNFAWKSNDSYDTHPSIVELQRSEKSPTPTSTGNVWGEIAAATEGKYIYQDIATTPGVMYKWSLKHASRRADSDDTMQVMIGAPGKETAQQANRDTSNGSDKTGSVGVNITTHGTAQNNQWETYSGTYIATGTVTRFTFKSSKGAQDAGQDALAEGNCIDDVMFTKAYKLTYDKNASDATGAVPSDTTVNTVKQAKTKTTGSVRLATDKSNKTKTDGVVKLASDTSSLSDHIVNGTFEYPSVPSSKWSTLVEGSSSNAYNKGKRFTTVNPGTGKYGMGCSMSKTGTAIPNWNRSSFAWSSTQGDTHHSDGMSCEAGNVELNYDSVHHNQFAELTADQAGTAIYQDVKVTPGTMMTWSLKHSSATSAYVDKMQVMIGEPYKETAQEATRIASENGNKVGKKMTTISTPTTSDRADNKKWDTYTGTYLVPDGVTTVRFTFKSVASSEWYSGNDLDDIQFSRSYKLTYDKNAQDASGKVPSDTTANTVKQAKSKTMGSVKLAADKTASGLTVHDLKKGDIAPVQYGDFKFSTTSDFDASQITNVDGFTVKKNWNPFWDATYTDGTDTAYFPTKDGANLTLHHVGQWRDASGTQRWINAKITVNSQNLGYLCYETTTRHFNIGYGKWDKHPTTRPYVDMIVDFLLDDGSTPQGLRGVTGFTDLDGGTDGYNEGVELLSGFDGAYVRSDAHLVRFGTNGWAGTTDENAHIADEHGMKHYVGATFTGASLRVRLSVASGQGRGSGFQPVDSTIAYRLTYDKNADDASGQVPSNETADTTQPAKTATTGSVRLASDRTDGTVKDLVQRTTTHEDGSVTVRTVDSSTDVVQGCQVYYPAGQKITLATMAKDDDCWDSSMLTRPGHTQLGWNQDRNATQAQAQVTMVEGGMTVYAVWVGNPVLTYDTNKPSTWNGQMPSTPASISVTYNTAAADGSGWKSGDVSKIQGYRFLGWYTGPQDNAGLYDWNTLLTGNVTVYAHWERLQAKVVYDRNASDATGSHAPTTGWQYSDVTVPGDTSKSFKRTGYRFAGWNTAKDGKGTAYADGGRVPLQDKDVTLYAQWTPVFDVLPSAGGDYGPSVPWLVCGGLALVALVGGVASTLLRLRRARGAHSR